MKPVSSLTLSFLLFAFIANISLAFSKNVNEQVLDINGNPIIPGGEYYIFPETQELSSGGLKLGRTEDSKCPLTVIQNSVITGLPVKFTIPKASSDIIIYTGTELDIEFTKKPNCAKSSKWLIYVDDDIQVACVGIGTPENYPHIDTLNGIFNIQKYGSGSAYKLGFCDDESPCVDIGRYEQEGGSRLILNKHDAYPVVFIDAAAFESGIIMSVA